MCLVVCDFAVCFEAYVGYEMVISETVLVVRGIFNCSVVISFLCRILAFSVHFKPRNLGKGKSG